MELPVIFTTLEKARVHLKDKAKYVTTANSLVNPLMSLMDTNYEKYDNFLKIVSKTSCLAHLAKPTHGNFDIREGLMITVHAITATHCYYEWPL